MGLTRQVSKPVLGWAGFYASASTFWTTGTMTGSTDHIMANASTYYSQVIDRLELGANFNVVDLAFMLASTWSSTEGAVTKGLAIGLGLQHGASSGGGDMAFVATTPDAYPSANFFTTLDTTDMAKYSTGILNPGIEVVKTYDLAGAYRYLRAAFSVTRKGGTSTCSDKVEGAHAANVLIFREPDSYPPRALSKFSTSTSTSTSLGYGL